MKTKLYRVVRLAVMVLAAMVTFSCQKGYEMTLPLAVNRDDFKLKASGGDTYFIVYSTSSWTIEALDDDSWISLSSYSGSGETQIDVNYTDNAALSRGVTYLIKSGSHTRTVYFSQEAGYAGDATYLLGGSSLSFLSGAKSVSISAKSTLPKENFDRGYSVVRYATQQVDWIKNITIGEDKLDFDVDENTSGEFRSASIEINFPVASWDDAVKTVLTVFQDKGGVDFGYFEESIDVDPDGINSLSIELGINFTPSIYPNYLLSFGFKNADNTPASWLRNAKIDASGTLFTAMPKTNKDDVREATLTFMIVDTTTGSVVKESSVLIKQAISEMGSGNVDGNGDEEPKDEEQDF